ncbi:GGDEF domain-containing protein [Shewanella sp. WXL01]|uniref:diguanylate cyclase DgcS n=1 Tax=Shewanella sp. WXL01 TaxID=2709721 RepID=UPI0014386113|nr:GGDEF domain-containing protein [Shewanella sp. WXL01]NKF51724.1 GGDEF domain-containing protein [Shewanella sp. WXL01]
MDFASVTELYPDDQWYRGDVYEQLTPEIDQVQIMQMLHASLDPRTVFSCFGNIVGQHLPLSGVQLNINQHQFAWGRRRGIEFQRSVEEHQTKYQFIYQLTQKLSAADVKKLKQIEQLMIQPLNNAIKYQAMSNQAMFDDLTKLGNRHYYQQAIKHAIARSERKLDDMTLIVADLDRFKQLNDNYGHQIGDCMLRNFADLLQNATRSTDQAFRLGGDEFVIITQGDISAAQIICQRIIDAAAEDTQMCRYDVKCSLGIAQAQHKVSADMLFDRADRAMYSAKAAGRNTYKVFSH